VAARRRRSVFTLWAVSQRAVGTEWTQGFHSGSALLQFWKRDWRRRPFSSSDESRTVERMAPHLTHLAARSRLQQRQHLRRSRLASRAERRIDSGGKWTALLTISRSRLAAPVPGARRWTRLPDGRLHSFVHRRASLFVDTSDRARRSRSAFTRGSPLMRSRRNCQPGFERLGTLARDCAVYTRLLSGAETTRNPYDSARRLATESLQLVPTALSRAEHSAGLLPFTHLDAQGCLAMLLGRSRSRSSFETVFELGAGKVSRRRRAEVDAMLRGGRRGATGDPPLSGVAAPTACRTGTPARPVLARIEGMARSTGRSLHRSLERPVETVRRRDCVGPVGFSARHFVWKRPMPAGERYNARGLLGSTRSAEPFERLRSGGHGEVWGGCALVLSRRTDGTTWPPASRTPALRVEHGATTILREAALYVKRLAEGAAYRRFRAAYD